MNTEKGPHEDFSEKELTTRRKRDSLARNQPCWHLGLGLQTWELWENTFLFAEANQSVAFCLWQPELLHGPWVCFTLCQCDQSPECCFIPSLSAAALGGIKFKVHWKCSWKRKPTESPTKCLQVSQPVCLLKGLLNFTIDTRCSWEGKPQVKRKHSGFGENFISGLALSGFPNAEVQQYEIVLLT